MLFVIFAISIITMELILRHDARQRARHTPDPSMDLLRLAQALEPSAGPVAPAEMRAGTEERVSTDGESSENHPQFALVAGRTKGSANLE